MTLAMACGIQIRFMGVSPRASSRALTANTVHSPIGQARGHAVSVNIDQLKTSALVAPSQMHERIATASIGRKEGRLEVDDRARTTSPISVLSLYPNVPGAEKR
jgi:hypothetical protein